MEENKTELLEPLFFRLNSLQPLSTIVIDELTRNFKIKQIPKGEILLHEGNVCNKLWFLIKGVLRYYHFITENEITSRIVFDTHIVISPGSFFGQTASTETIEALQPSIIAELTFEDLQSIYKKFPEFNFHGRKITEQYFINSEQRLYLLRKHNAADKYLYFLENFPGIINKIPHKYIASFLGISPETLSRVRHSLSEKNNKPD